MKEWSNWIEFGTRDPNEDKLETYLVGKFCQAAIQPQEGGCGPGTECRGFQLCPSPTEES